MKDFISRPRTDLRQEYSLSNSGKNTGAVTQKKSSVSGPSAYQLAQSRRQERGEEIPLKGDPISRFHALKAGEKSNTGNAMDAPIQRQEASPDNTGLPDTLKSGVENLSGYSMDDVKVHYNSPMPATLQAHAYAQGTDIHIASGQEKHLPHEAWHIVQQKQGRVKPTLQMKEKEVTVNDDAGLESEADVMGAKATQLTGNETGSIQKKPAHMSPVFQLVKKEEKGWYTDDNEGPFESEELAKYAEANPGEISEIKKKPALAKFIIRWTNFDTGSIPLLEKGSFHDKGREKGITFEGGNNGMWVEHKDDQKNYFVKGYAVENMSENHAEIDKKKKETGESEWKELLPEDDEKTSGPLLTDQKMEMEESLSLLSEQPSDDGKSSIPDNTSSSVKSKKGQPSFEKKLKQAMKNKKAIYEYIAIRAYHEAGLKPPFDSHLFQDEENRVFVANDWAKNVDSVLPDERKKTDSKTEVKGTEEITEIEEIKSEVLPTEVKEKKRESEHDRWNRAKPFVQESRAFKEGLVLDLVLGMHDLLNADNWKSVNGEVMPFDFGGPFDVRATAQTLNDKGKQDKEGWELPKNVNLIGRWLDMCTLSMLNYGDSTDKLKKKSVYSNVSDETLQASAEFMSGKWAGLIEYIEKELRDKGVHEEEVKELVSVLNVRAKSMQFIADRKLSKGQYISWDPEESLSGKFKGLNPDPKGRMERMKSSENSGPLVATAPGEKVEGGGTLHTELIETEFNRGQICVRVYQTSFAPLTEKTLTGKFKDVYQRPLDKQVMIEPNRKDNGGMAATCYGIGRPLRALKWVEKYLTQNGVNVDAQPVVRTFLIPHKAYIALLDKTIQHESDYENKHGMSQNVDSISAPDQYELTESHINELQKQALPDTLQTYTINDVKELPQSSKIDHGTAYPMRALYDKVGVPVFADTLSNEYHPWLKSEDHLDQRGVGAKSKVLHRLSDAFDLLKSSEWKGMDSMSKNSEDSKGEENQKETKVLIDLKSFLLLHLGPKSRYLKGIQREMLHKGIDKNEMEEPLLLSTEPYITSNDRDILLSNNTVTFFMEEILGSAMTQLEILAQHGDWTKALKEEKKPSSDEESKTGIEVYSYGKYEGIPYDYGERKVEHFSPPKMQGSIRETIFNGYTEPQLCDYDIRAEKSRHLNVLNAMKNSGLFEEGFSEDTQTLISTIASSDKISELLKLSPEEGGISKEDLMDLFINIGIYGDAWTSGGRIKEENVELESGRRSEGYAEYLSSDLKEFSKDRSKKESKPENIVRRELNAELKAIPKLEKFLDKDIRISPQNPNINKYRADISPIVTMAQALAQIPEESEDRIYMELNALKAALEMIYNIMKNQTLKHSKSQSEEIEIHLWKTISTEMTNTIKEFSIASGKLQSQLEKVNDLEDLVKLIEEITQQRDKLYDEQEVGLGLFEKNDTF